MGIIKLVDKALKRVDTSVRGNMATEIHKHLYFCHENAKKFLGRENELYRVSFVHTGQNSMVCFCVYISKWWLGKPKCTWDFRKLLNCRETCAFYSRSKATFWAVCDVHFWFTAKLVQGKVCLPPKLPSVWQIGCEIERPTRSCWWSDFWVPHLPVPVYPVWSCLFASKSATI